MTRANNSVIALVTSGLVASCFYGNATLLPSSESGGTGSNLTQGGQAGHGASGNGGVVSTAGTVNARTAGTAGKASTSQPSAAGSAGASGGQNRAGAAGLATNLGGAGVGGRSTAVAGNAGYAGTVEPLSCQGLEPCGGESCCTPVLVPGGVFPRGSAPNEKECTTTNTCEPSEMPKASVTVSSFYLDKYEVTVGRFRQFLNAYDSSKPPKSGDGANTSVVRGGNTGWDSTWNTKLRTKAKLIESLADAACSKSTWPELDGSNNDRYPINCIDWYTAFAFCIWDGGRLPTETEWEYAAAGGEEDRVYPWGDANPTTELASFAPGTPRLSVGSKPAGKGRWQHLDLAGSVFEWTLDTYDAGWYSTDSSLVANPVNLGNITDVRSARGGSALDGTTSLRAAARHPTATADLRMANLGVRCARNVPAK
ncbi:MAG TPA: SUMF1/EgtB/PvdO family nonheme iron enzyme [Polyangiaceae bacterium]|nr:SUMF1/EgtB/PvdO family nonheme iron enzyme [Polyangiaceae bacterium]